MGGRIKIGRQPETERDNDTKPGRTSPEKDVEAPQHHAQACRKSEPAETQHEQWLVKAEPGKLPLINRKTVNTKK